MTAPIGALAQEIDHYDPASGDPTNVPLLEQSRPLAAWALTTVFLVGAMAIAFKSSKRSHLD